MQDFFTNIWRCFTDVEVPVFGANGMTAADLVIGFFIAGISIMIFRFFFKDKM